MTRQRLCPKHKCQAIWYRERSMNIAWAFCPICGEMEEWRELDFDADLDNAPLAHTLILDLIRKHNEDQDSLIATLTKTKESMLEATVALSNMRHFITKAGLWEKYLDYIHGERRLLFNDLGEEVKDELVACCRLCDDR